MTRFAFALGAVALLPTLGYADVTPRTLTTAVNPHYRVKEILGTTVLISGNTSVGVVDDIVLDAAGNVDYLIVTTPEKRLVTVPWSAALLDLKKRSASIDITPERYRVIPTYTVDQYPTFSAPAYRTQMDQYYGMTPERRRIIKRGNPGIIK